VPFRQISRLTFQVRSRMWSMLAWKRIKYGVTQRNGYNPADSLCMTNVAQNGRVDQMQSRCLRPVYAILRYMPE
jgi:hypothetical protein